MTQGFLVFAHDNEQIEYGLLALAQAQRIQRLMSKPVSIVLDSKTEDNLRRRYPNFEQTFDRVIRQESQATQTKRYGDAVNQLTFHNLDRTDAYGLTPYDETIVIDVDVLIQTARLDKLWGSEHDLMVCERATDLYGNQDQEFTWVSDRSIKFYWATLFYFRKTDATRLFFDHCRWVKEHYGWLSYVYELPSGPMRNDYVWSIALHDLNYPAGVIPFNLPYAKYEDRIYQHSSQSVRFLTAQGLTKLTTDVHVFNKFDLTLQVEKDLA